MFQKYILNKRFFISLLIMTLPLSLQNIFEASVHILNTSMIGFLGDASIAATGIANQIVFIFIVLLFSICNGAGVLIAQFFGAKDYTNIKKIVWLNIFGGIVLSIGFTILCIAIPELMFEIFTTDVEVINIGSEYLRIISIGFLPTGIVFPMIFSLRSMEIVRVPTLVTVISLVISITLSYLFIYGAYGFTQLGVNGAAVGNAISKIIELFIMYFIFIKYKKVVPKLDTYKTIAKNLSKKVIDNVTPIILNEITWVLAITVFLAIYTRMGTELAAAANIFITIEKLGVVLFWGLAQASCVLVGNRIGEGKLEKGYVCSGLTLHFSVFLGILISGILYIFRLPIIEFFNASQVVNGYTLEILTVFIVVLPIKAFNTINLVGVLRSGGDAGYAFIMESICQWTIAIPLTVIFAFYLELDVKYVYLAQCSEEIIKFFWGYKRYKSKKWINNLVEAA